MKLCVTLVHLFFCHRNNFVNNLRIFLLIHWTYRIKNSYQKQLLGLFSFLGWQILQVNMRLLLFRLVLVLYPCLVLFFTCINSLCDIFLPCRQLWLIGNSWLILILLIVLERIRMAITLIFRSDGTLSWSLADFHWWRWVLNTPWLSFSFDFFIQILCHIGYFVKISLRLISHNYHLVLCVL